MSRLHAVCALLAAASLAGCALFAPPRGSVAPFDLVGRVAVIFDGRAFSSNLRWSHAPGREELWLMTPLGQALAYIESGDTGATLTGADRQRYHAASVESLTGRALGWELPLASLTWWVRGEPVPDAPASGEQHDGRQRLTALEQHGWRISWVHYPPGEQGGLPRRLELRRGGQEIRLVIDAWRETGTER
ncbi:MAG: outer membrane lipoprotein LolB [Burkholderiales bacterium]|nr:outer membrane lipoprotein LolB [Burkholderiales bacterium]